MRVTIEQIRGARAMLNWFQAELADRSGVAKDTIMRIETGKTTPQKDTLEKIVHAFELAGIEFTKDGIKKGDTITVLEGQNINFQILDDIYSRLKDEGGEVLIAGLTEVSPDDTQRYEFLKKHIERLQKAGISERILIEDGNTNFVAPKTWYRYLPKNKFNNTPFQVYADRIVMKEWGPPERMVIIQNVRFAETLRNLFDLVWDQAKPITQ